MNLDSADTRVFENLMGQMYEKHPIRIPILGTQESIADITEQTLYDCHRAFYHPGNMILCIVGIIIAVVVLALRGALMQMLWVFGVYALVILLASIVASVAASRKNVLELLQTKE